jgi:hypothetical protein
MLELSLGKKKLYNQKIKSCNKKTKLNKTININKKMQKQNKTTKLLNQKTYIIFLRCTSHFKLQNLHMAKGGEIHHFNKQ